MNVVFVEPFFPSNQRHFARALAEAGATVIGVGEYPADALDDQLKGWLHHYEQVPSVTDVEAMTRAVRWAQDKLWVDRLEATIEAHTMATAQVREACTHPGHVGADGLAVPGQAVDEAGAARGGGADGRLGRGGQRRRGPRLRRAGRLPADPQAAQRRRRAGHDAGRRCRRPRARPGRLRRPGRRVDRRGGVRRGPRGLLRHDHDRRAGGAGLRLALLPERARRDAGPVDLARSSSPPTGSTPRRSTPSCARWAGGSSPPSGSGRRRRTWSGSSARRG